MILCSFRTSNIRENYFENSKLLCCLNFATCKQAGQHISHAMKIAFQCISSSNLKLSHINGWSATFLMTTETNWILWLHANDIPLLKTLEPDAAFRHDVGFPHTTHCLADGNIMISTLSDADGNHKGKRPFIKLAGSHTDFVWFGEMIGFKTVCMCSVYPSVVSTIVSLNLKTLYSEGNLL